MNDVEAHELVTATARSARAAQRSLARAPRAVKDAALEAMAHSLTALLAVSATASAGFSENGQAAASQNAVTRVAALRSVPDDSYVTLEGYIERQVRHEHYIFRDASGRIEVEIDDDVWRGLNVTPRDKVRLEAEIDQEWRRTEVDVKSVTRIQ